MSKWCVAAAAVLLLLCNNVLIISGDVEADSTDDYKKNSGQLTYNFLMNAVQSLPSYDSCLPYQLPANVESKCQRDQCEVSCAGKYKFPNGETVLKMFCDSGQWTIRDAEYVNVPPCEAIYIVKGCRALTVVPKNSKISCSRNICNVECMQGFQFPDGSGVKNVECRDGKWINGGKNTDYGTIQTPECSPNCDPTCDNGGICVFPNMCQCQKMYRGDHCQYNVASCNITKTNFNGNSKCSYGNDEAKCKLSCPDEIPGVEIQGSIDIEYKCKYESGNFYPLPMPKCIYPPGWDIAEVNITTNSSVVARCTSIGDPHYKTFDGKYFDFMGACSYYLLKTSELSVEAENVACSGRRSPTCTKSVTLHFKINGEPTKVLLEQGRVVKVNDREALKYPLVLGTGKSQVVIRHASSTFITVNFANGMRIWWDGDTRAYIDVPTSYNGRTSGLCGTLNSNPEDDFETPEGVLETAVESFADSWRTNDTCGHTIAVPDPCTANPKKAKVAAEYCKEIKRVTFQSCSSAVEIEQYYKTCMYDVCACEAEPSKCACPILSALGTECLRQGIDTAWRLIETRCAVQCPAGQVFDDCGDSCKHSCDDLAINMPCKKECVEGCRCPNGEYLNESNKCVPQNSCPAPTIIQTCTHDGTSYNEGEKRKDETGCNTCTCSDGQWKCTDNKCEPGRCHAIGDPHYKTFDGKRYDFMGNCSYYLLKTSELSVEAENVACSGRRKPTCTKSVTLHFNVNGEPTKVQLEQGRVVKVNDREVLKFPLVLGAGNSQVVIRHASSTFITVNFANGTRVSWDGVTRVYIDVPASYYGKTAGLCGTLNSNKADDFLTPAGVIETTVELFADSWRTNDTCGTTIPVPDPCTANPKKAKVAAKYCKEIKGDIFAECSSTVEIEEYYKNCMYDVCACDEEPSKCACPILSTLGTECLRQGIDTGWRVIEWKCAVKCPIGQEFAECGDSCQRSCADLGTKMPCQKDCIEGCRCPNGEYLNESNKCVPQNSCPAPPQTCTHNGTSYNEGEKRKDETGCNTCTCKDGQWKCTDNKCKPARCHAIGDPHYKTFDGKRYDFMGNCSYYLLKTSELSVEAENVACSGRRKPTCTKSVTLHFNVNGEPTKVQLEQGRVVKVNDREVLKFPLVLGTGNSQVVIRHASSTFVTVNFANGTRVSWDGVTRVYIDVPASYYGKTAGLCGTLNSNKADDFITPAGVIETTVELFADSWRTNDTCGTTIPVPDPCTANPKKAKVAAEYCKEIKGDIFAECSSTVEIEEYYKNCMYDVCACDEEPSKCACPILSTLGTECLRQGIDTGWRVIETKCAVKCPIGQEFAECGDSCQRSCADLGTKMPCQKDCIEGCRCPNGEYLNESNKCVPQNSCPAPPQTCTHNGTSYNEGEKRKDETGCNTCTCKDGQWKCTDNKCKPARCHAIGDPHYKTFDGKRYDFMGNCSYYLLKTSELSVEAENVACSGRRKPTCTKSVTLHFNVNGEPTKVQLEQGRVVKVNDREVLKFPLVLGTGNSQVVIRHASSTFVTVNFANGTRVSWDGVTRVYIDVPASYYGKTAGLCGTLNSNKADDFITPAGVVETAVELFADSWRTNDTCGTTIPVPDPCTANPKKAKVAAEYCKEIKGDIFAECSSTVEIEEYYKNCMYDVCACDEEPSKCACPILSTLGTECLRQGIDTGWRVIETKCAVKCPIGQEFAECGDSCQRSCADLGTKMPCQKDCVEGCRCPNGQYLNESNKCVPQNSCPAPPQTCNHNGTSYNEGDKMKDETGCNTCICKDGQWKCTVEKCEPARCHGIGDPHYKTLDGKHYDFMGTCSYYLLKTSELSVEAENVACSEGGNPTCTKSLTLHFNVNGEPTKVQLEKGLVVKVNDREVLKFPLVLGTGNSQVVIRHASSTFITVNFANGIRVWWDEASRFYIDVPARYRGKTAGLCGTFNSNPEDDFQTPKGVLETAVEPFADSWRTNDTCGTTIPVPDPCTANPEKAKVAAEYCKEIKGDIFAECSSTVETEEYYKNCMYDVCACKEEPSKCACPILSTLGTECLRQGINTGWRVIEEKCAVKCPIGQEFAECGDSCQRSCADLGTKLPCQKDCAEGCRCPNGQYLNESNKCVPQNSCPAPPQTCTHNGTSYNEGDKMNDETGCNTCICKDGQWKCTVEKCEPARCHGIGDPHYKTLDGKHYDFMGTCSYYLLKTSELSVEAENVACSEGGNPTCTKSLTLHFNVNGEPTKVQLEKGLVVKVNDREVLKFPLVLGTGNSQVVIRHASSTFITVNFANGIRVWWDEASRFYIDVPARYRGKTAGLCGTFNSNPDDDFQTPKGVLETAVEPFADSWRTNDTCGTTIPVPDPCTANPKKAKVAAEYCKEIKGDIFAECSSSVETEEYYKNCMYDVCACKEEPSKCACPILSTLGTECLRQGINTGWRVIEKKCAVKCPIGQEFAECGDSCQRSCADLGTKVPCQKDCAEGCRCPNGQYLNESNKCVPQNSCPAPPQTCTHNGTSYNEGDKMKDETGCNTCICKDGQWKCTVEKCEPARCHGIGDPHYKTLDGKHYDFMGTCSYYLLKTSELSVEAENVACSEGGNPTCTKSLTLHFNVNGEPTKVQLEKGLVVKVNDREVLKFPLVLGTGNSQVVIRHASSTFITVNFANGIRVWWDEASRFYIDVPAKYRGKTAGLCGTFNSNPDDDFQTPKGVLETAVEPFADSWRTNDTCGTTIPVPDPCTANPKKAKVAAEYCKEIKGDIFAECSSTVETEEYYKNCMYDVCACKEEPSKCACPILSTLGTECLRQGINTGWRVIEEKCAVKCPIGQEFAECGDSCQRSCADLGTKLPCQKDCAEGCRCPNGQYLNESNKCVPQNSCPAPPQTCTHNGTSYNEGDKMKDETGCNNCICKDGQWECTVEKCEPARCHGIGDPHYKTFDGKHYDFMGTCSYYLLKTSELSVEAENVACSEGGNPTCTKSLTLHFNVNGEPTKVQLEKGLVVKVNDREVLKFPLVLGTGNSQVVIRHASSTFITVNFANGIRVWWDEASRFYIDVPAKYRGKTAGLCGTFNSNPDDDFQTPKGVLETAVEPFADSWRTNDTCGTTIPVPDPCTANPKKAKVAAEYCKEIKGDIFAECSSTVETEEYYKNCMYDVCACKEEPSKCACPILSTLGTECLRQGINTGWRVIEKKCAVKCPIGQEFAECGDSCQRSCADLGTKLPCQKDCAEGCRCPNGQYLNESNKCVPQNSCPAPPQTCTHNGTSYNEGDKMKDETGCNTCICKDGQWKCTVEKCEPARCHGIGDPHYKTLDGKHYDFMGTCSYYLLKTSELSVEAENVACSEGGNPTCTKSLTLHFNVNGEPTKVQLEKGLVVKVNDREVLKFPLVLGTGNSQVVIRHASSTFITVNFANGIRVWWDEASRFYIDVPAKYRGKTAGLCGTFNSNPDDDFQTPKGVLETAVEPFADSWRTNDTCGTTIPVPDPCTANPKKAKVAAEYCKEIKGDIFAECSSTVETEEYYKNCMYDVCACKEEPSKCACPILSTLGTECLRQGINTGWRVIEEKCAVKCPIGQEFAECGDSCQRSCADLGTKLPCQKDCAEGCRCPNGQYLNESNKCVPQNSCPAPPQTCTHNGTSYNEGDKMKDETGCNNCICKDGQWECTVEKCEPARCHGIGDPHYKTLDGKHYDFMGTCSYYLLKTSELSVEAENVACSEGGNPTCTKSLTLHFNVNGEPTKVQLEKGLVVKVNDREVLKFPLVLGTGNSQVVIRHASSTFITVNFANGIRVWWDEASRFYIDVPAKYRGKTAGLCGTFNSNPDDDFQTPKGVLETAVEPFADSWRTNDTCGTTIPVPDPCTANPKKAKVAAEYCKEIKGDIFAECSSTVETEEYYKNCMYDVCACKEEPSKCACPILSTLGTECLRQGINTGWRVIEEKCAVKCPIGQEFAECGDSCQRSCADLGTKLPCQKDCAEGCRCPNGQYLNESNKCVPQNSCPAPPQTCTHNGTSYNEGDKMKDETGCNNCICKDGQWECTVEKCEPARCHGIGDPHYKTLDGKHYDFMGTCSYYLLKTSELSVEAENVACSEGGNPTCTKSLTLHFNVNGEPTKVQLEKGLVVKVNDREVLKFPLVLGTGNSQVVIRHASSTFITVNFANGIRVWWDEASRFYIDVPARYRGKTAGLCGTFNSNPDDDFQTPKGVLETAIEPFADSWRTNDTCGTTKPVPNPCTANPKKAKVAAEYCKEIKGDIFAECSSTVETEEYYKNCMYDVCACKEEPSKCACPILSTLGTECLRQGINTGWRVIEEKCAVKCPIGQEFAECGDSCQRSCADLGTKLPCQKDCAEGCRCPNGQYLNESNKCVPQNSCPAPPQTCTHNGTSYNEGDKMKDETGCNNCICKDGQWECTVEKCEPARCHGIGDPHYKTLDGKHYDFMGTCSYYLLKTSELSVEAENVACSEGGNPTCTKSLTLHFNVNGEPTKVQLEKGLVVKVNDREVLKFPLVLGTGNSQVVIRHASSTFITVNFANGIRVWWDEASRFYIDVPARYRGKTAGLCGTFNSNPDDDFQTPKGVLETAIEPFADSWRTNDTCGTTKPVPNPCTANPKKAKVAAEYCKEIKGDIFAECSSTVETEEYYKNCMYDVCACKEEPSKCACPILSTLGTECLRQGINTGWRVIEEKCAVKCPIGQEFAECGDSCQRSCADLGTKLPCQKDCAEGCRCPNGQYLNESNKCVPQNSCPAPPQTCTHNGTSYNEGDKMKDETGCNNCICKDGQWECTVEKCEPARCHGIGDPHYKTLDGKHYDFMGTCSYYLLKTSELSVEAENVACSEGGNPTCTKSLTLHFNVNGEPTKVQLEKGLVVKVNDREVLKFPLVLGTGNSQVVIRHASSTFITVNFANGIRVWWDEASRFYIDVPARYRGKTAGLCGTFNSNPEDDFQTPKGVLETAVEPFADSWRTNDTCGTTIPVPDPCTANPEKAKVAAEYCKEIKGDIFAECSSTVETEEYYKNCMYDVCACKEEPSKCACPILSTLGTECLRQGIDTGWRVIETKCAVKCPIGQEFAECGDSCQRSCADLGTKMPCQKDCVEGCRCPNGQYLNESNKCVPQNSCPAPLTCTHDGRSYNDGAQRKDNCNVCICQAGNWKCSSNGCESTCSVWGDSHFTTYDNFDFDFQGACDYILSKGVADNGDSFTITIQNVLCGTMGVTCSKSVKIAISTSGVEDSITLTTDSTYLEDPSKSAISRLRDSVKAHGSFQIYVSGVFIVIEVIPLKLQVKWDEGTRVYVKLGNEWKRKVNGLCGNYNDNDMDDMETPSHGLETSPLLFGDSWKVRPDCRTPTQPIDACKEHPERETWAQLKCGVLKSSLFEECHAEVPVQKYLKRCIFDTCACDQGGDCDCLCTAMSAYAHSCSQKGISIRWRKPHFCPMQCDGGEYDSCTPACAAETCDSQPERMCNQETCLEGCKIKPCNQGMIYLNDTYIECVSKSECKSVKKPNNS